MLQVPKLLITLGCVLIVVGLLWQFSDRFFKFGQLPGDFSYEKENFKFYAPLGTSLLLSLILSIVFWLISSFQK